MVRISPTTHIVVVQRRPGGIAPGLALQLTAAAHKERIRLAAVYTRILAKRNTAHIHGVNVVLDETRPDIFTQMELLADH